MVFGINISIILKVFLRSILFLVLFYIFTSGTASAQVKSAKMEKREITGAPDKRSESKAIENKSAEASPEIQNCAFAKNSVDEKEGSVIRVMKREKFIGYTPPEMKSLFPDNSYITIDGYLSNYNKSIVMFLKITILSNNALSTYGSIYKNNELMLKTESGQVITLRCGQSESGSINNSFDRTTYLTYFEVDEFSQSLLQNSPVVAARLFWGKGYEDYEISKKDFFIRQLSCVR